MVAFDFSLHTAMVGALGSSAILAITLLYLWHIDPEQRHLRVWALAFFLQAVRMGGELGAALGIDTLWYLAQVAFAAATFCLWLGSHALAPTRGRGPLIAVALIAALAWEFLANAAGYPFFVRVLPLHFIAGGTLLYAGRTVWRLAAQAPGVGYPFLSLLLIGLGLHYFDYPFLRGIAWFAPLGFALAASIVLAIGLAVLIITQRRQQFALREVSQRLRAEILDRREADERYRTLVNELEEGILVVSSDERILLSNPAAEQILGLPLAELGATGAFRRPYLLYRESGEVLTPEDYPLNVALRQGRPSPAQVYRMVREDGSESWLSINTHPMFREGNPVPYAATVSLADVNSRKAAERSIAESELRFRSIFEAVPNIAVQGYDAQRQVVYWNDASERFYGYTAAEAHGQTIDALVIQPADAPKFREDFAAMLTTRQPTAPGEYLARRKDGSGILIYSTQVLINNLAGDAEVYCIDLDLSELRRLQGELGAASERFNAIAESSEMGVVVADSDGRFVYCNNRYLTLSASTPEEVRDGSWIDHLHPDDREPMRQQWREAVATRTGFSMERRVIDAAGRIIWAQAHIVPIRGGGGDFRGFVATVEEITARKNAEEALRESEAKFRAIFDQAFQFVGLLDTSGRVLDANHTALEFAGVEREEIIGHPFWQTVWWQSSEDIDKVRAAIQSAAQGETVRFETELVDRQGDARFIDFSIKPVRDPQGRPVMLMPEGRDITPQKLSEQALRLSEGKFSGAFHGSLDYITISRLDTGEILEANEAFETISGWSRAEAIGRNTLDLGIWPEEEARRVAVAQLLRDGALREYPMVLGTKDGRLLRGMLSASVIDVEGDRYMLGVFRDRTAQIVAEQALRDSEEKFSRIVHYSPVALALTDVKTGVVVDLNQAWQDLFGFTREMAIGKSSAESGLWLDHDDRAQLYAALAASGGKLDRYECRYRHASGRLIHCLASGRRIEMPGRECFLWSIIDISLQHELSERLAQLNTELEARVEARTTQLKRAQEELVRSEKLAALGSLVAGIAHELNTPIGNAVTVASTLHEKTEQFTEVVKGGELRRSTLNEYVGAAGMASDLLLRNLGQARHLVASFKQVAVDQTSEQRRRFRLAEVVSEILTTLSPALRKRPYRIDMTIPDDIELDSYPGRSAR